MDDLQHGLIDNWLRHIKDIQRFHKRELSALETKEQKFDRLCELNVIEQVHNILNTTIVINAISSGKKLQVHGFIYDIKDGLLRDLKVN